MHTELANEVRKTPVFKKVKQNPIFWTFVKFLIDTAIKVLKDLADDGQLNNSK